MEMTHQTDSLILGANPLLGVDHFSRARGRDRVLGIDSERIQRVMNASFESGASGFTIGVDPILYNVLHQMRETGSATRFGIYLILPDMRTYSSAFMTRGALGVVRDLLSNLSVTGKAKAITQGGLSMLTADPMRAMNMYIDIELSRLSDIKPFESEIKGVFAFEAITDMIVALNVKSVFREYVRHVTDTHGIKAGFVTRNFPRFVDFCEDSNVSMDELLVMTPFNRLGFQMTPSREECEKTLDRVGGSNVIGMSLMAGGALQLEDAAMYLSELEDLRSVVLGTSTESHARATFTLMRKALLHSNGRTSTGST